MCVKQDSRKLEYLNLFEDKEVGKKILEKV